MKQKRAVISKLKAKLPLDNARRNNPYFWSQFKQVKAAVDELYDEYVVYTKDKKAKQDKSSYSIQVDAVPKIKRHIENPALDLYSVWTSDKTKYPGYSRDQGHFRKAPPKDDAENQNFVRELFVFDGMK